MTIITKRTAANHIDVQEEITGQEESWTADFGYETAKLVPTIDHFKNGKPVRTHNLLNMWLDGESSEIDYVWVKEHGKYFLTELHNAEGEE